MTEDPSAPTTIVDTTVGRERVDVRIEHGRIATVGPGLPRRGTRVVQARGGALVPGLHDHHLHLLAMAARERSVDLDGLERPAQLDRRLREAHASMPVGDWLRVVGYDEVLGPLRPDRLERVAPGRPIRIQHRSGAAWRLSPAGAAAAGIARDEGWIHRDDERLRAAWSTDEGPPDLTGVGRRLAGYGVTGVTDATPSTDPAAFEVLAGARARGELPQRVVVTGGVDLAAHSPPNGLESGPVKLVVADHELPEPGRLAAWIRAAHDARRPVAVHCVTRVALVLVVLAWEQVGAVDGDRIEHASVVPVELLGRIRELGVRIVTQPGFVHAHGDRYLRTVEPPDLPHLYRCASLLEAAIPVAGSTDAPFGPEDPWVAIAAATNRTTAAGCVLGRDERLGARSALELFLGHPGDPGGPPRSVHVGAPADLCLLDAPLSAALASPSSDRVVATWVGGTLIHDRT